MTSRLTIVVTCADRKSLPVVQHLRFRDVPSGRPAERARDWRERLRGASERRPLTSLYQGEQWKASLQLAKVAHGEGFEPMVLVASAGLGLQELQARAPAYSATFSLANPDAVADNADGAAAWWGLLLDQRNGLNLASLHGPVLLVLSRNYALPLATDLAELGKAGTGTALVGGAVEVPGIARVPADAMLRRTLGGTLSSLNQRMASRFLQFSCGPSGWLSEPHFRRWNSWVSQSRHAEAFDRQRCSDPEIKAWIRVLVTHQSISASAALREYRSHGYACEQSRFTRLYREVVM